MEQWRAVALLVALTVTLGVTVTSPALALEGRLVPLDSSSSVLVWHSKDAMDEGHALMRANADPKVIVPLAACAVKSGTRAVSTIKTEGSMFGGYAVAVTFIEGPSRGAVGSLLLRSSNTNRGSQGAVSCDDVAVQGRDGALVALEGDVAVGGCG
jgi:hypothetical protein